MSNYIGEEKEGRRMNTELENKISNSMSEIREKYNQLTSNKGQNQMFSYAIGNLVNIAMALAIENLLLAIKEGRLNTYNFYRDNIADYEEFGFDESKHLFKTNLANFIEDYLKRNYLLLV